VAVKGGACAIATRRSLASALDGRGDDRTLAGGPGRKATSVTTAGDGHSLGGGTANLSVLRAWPCSR
jgi:hypothetical protein